MKYRAFFIIISFCVFSTHVAAQDSLNKMNSVSSMREKIVWGGNIGLSFGNVTTIGASPIVGYKVTERFVPGIGFSYYYTKFHFTGYTPVSTYYYGGSIWARYYLLERIFVHGEAETLNGEWDPYLHPGYRDYRNSYLLGGGYREFNGRLSTYVLVLYVLNFAESAYNSPLVIRAGFAVGM
ncbi:MAG: hypothetical protein HY064_17255 [Bacteroidetes bacterium]|nr:hypothetical protein [Bacteroidota bacterium]